MDDLPTPDCPEKTTVRSPTAARSSSSPSPVCAETGKTGMPSARYAATDGSIVSRATRSILFSTRIGSRSRSAMEIR